MRLVLHLCVEHKGQSFETKLIGMFHRDAGKLKSGLLAHMKCPFVCQTQVYIWTVEHLAVRLGQPARKSCELN